MFFKKHFFILSIAVLSLTGCHKKSSFETQYLLKNFTSFSAKNVENSATYFKGNKSNFETIKNLNIPFLVYFTSDTCSKCEKFSSIFKAYLKDNNPFVFTVTNNENIQQFLSIYKNLFFEDTEISVPYLGVFYNNKCTKIDNSKFMQTKNAFKNFMTSNYRISNVSFTSEKFEPILRNEEFTYISYETSDIEIVNIYKEKFDFLQSTKRETIISNYEASGLEIFKYVYDLNNELYLKEKAQISNETEPDLINNFF